MNYLELIEIVKHGYDKINIYVEDAESFKITVKMGEIEDLKTYKSREHYIRVLHDGKLCTYRVSGSNLEVIKESFGKIKGLFDYLKPDKNIDFPKMNKFNENLFIRDEIFEKLDHNKHLTTALEIEANALNYSNYIKNVRHTTFSSTLEKIYIINSDGDVVSQESTYFSGSTYVVADNGKDSQSGYDFSVTRFYDDFDYNLVGVRAAESAVRLLNAKKLNSGKYYLVFENTVMAEFLDLIADLVNAENIIKNKSFLKEKLGKKIASSVLTIYDDTKLERGVGSYYFDDEGVVGGKTDIISEGELKSYLHNSYTSKKLNTKNTGNASLSSSGKIEISSSNFIVKEGEKELQSEITKYNDVLLITDVMGMHMADPISGEFSVGINGIYYKNGEAVTPFKEMVLTANLKELLENCAVIFNDIRDFGGIITPSVMFDKFPVSGS
ncbi:TldD/PmbA family protein [Deferribacter autotrophicus]|uniref:TldD/PmbA family protein n=1 Tax=Deferribacter autotrophicus TaxID=500465 RepID=A0A5A8F180_9BACT|nr:metallopeptidase TldD-related protein [Deferribacter autotrophicus]KAA0257419.1 TldD/PmbA family protein [Deferribacter autotrophicus]